MESLHTVLKTGAFCDRLAFGHYLHEKDQNKKEDEMMKKRIASLALALSAALSLLSLPPPAPPALTMDHLTTDGIPNAAIQTV